MNTSITHKPIKSYSSQELNELLKSYGQPPFRANQLVQWLYQRGASSYNDMTDFPKALRQQLADNHPLFVSSIEDKQVSSDGTRKYLLSYYDGSLVETVGIPSGERLTVCFSTQIGCPMGCVFCATGKEGFTRNLSVGEIIDQILVVQSDFGKRVTNLVGMGQGEPFLNYDAVVSALDIINSKKGLGIGARKITLSTCGILDGIRKFSEIREQYTLAVSLHSARQDVRDTIMPHVSSQPLSTLHKELLSYIEKTKRRVTFEYTLISGLNDQQEDLEALLQFCRDLLCHVNLIRLNDTPDSLFYPSSQSTMYEWKDILERNGIETTIRISKGSDIFGACGQLKNARA